MNEQKEKLPGKVQTEEDSYGIQDWKAKIDKLEKELLEKNRELEIEASLERIRGHAITMKDSRDLSAAAGMVFSELKKLGIHPFRSGVGLLTEEPCKALLYAAMEGSDHDALVLVGTVDMSAHACFELQYQSCLKQENYFPVLNSREFQSYYAALADQLSVPLPEESQFKQKHYGNYFPFKEGYFYTWSNTPYSVKEISILERFKSIIALTFRRYLDLQKAEAQAREASIEVSLERVRSKAMSMQHSNELGSLIATVFNELTNLDLVLTRCVIFIFDKETRDARWWMANSEDPSNPMSFNIQYHEHQPYQEILKAWREKQAKCIINVSGKIKKDWDDFLFNKTELSTLPDFVIEGMKAPERVMLTASFNGFGGINVASLEPLSDEHVDILLRFARVFEMTYTRFHDLKHAEAQARESQIQLAMERVRARTMAMQTSDELSEAANLLFQQVQSLGMPTWAAGYCIWNEDKSAITLWMSSEGVLQPPFQAPTTEDELFIQMRKGQEEGKTFHVVEMGGDKLAEHYRYMRTLPVVGKIFDSIIATGHPLPTFQIMHHAYFSKGFLLFITYEPVPDAHDIFIRFGQVFDQTYTRFLDLQKAEAQAKEAKIEASLERVRAKAMSMHSSQDLSDTIAAFYHELENFSITPLRCGVGLLNHSSRSAELSTMNTTEHGKSIEIIGTLEMSGHPVLEAVYDNWLLQKEYHPVLRGAEITAYYQLVRPQIHFPAFSNDAIQYGYFFFFAEGGVYAWTEKEMNEDELKIYRRFTSVLSLTYKRYKDLQQAESLAQQAEQDLIKLKQEKKKTEEALSELKTTQAQLIQSEKMASLGELTAGIAHEIQNPLNFVNNFSDVSAELVDEMKEQLAIGNWQQANQVAADLKQNLEKILHHGKRADGIVKGMLQHSRSNSGRKEATDINSLVDEYLRLAFHGLRAKDKSFNATLQTEFDSNIGEIKLVPQDIGRVLVNLLNNSFYAVNEKRKALLIGYQPHVLVSTKKMNDRVEIQVSDNGNGIPKEVLEKIFQPFFTTKPTGQGTGLGLSLSYDIVKTHGGELTVSTEPGERTTFTVSLPIGQDASSY